MSPFTSSISNWPADTWSTALRRLACGKKPRKVSFGSAAMWVSDSSATRNAASARNGFANAHKAAAVAVCLRNPRRSMTIGMLLNRAGHLFYLIQFFLEAGSAPPQGDDVQQHDNPGGQEPVKHEG